MNLGLEFGRRQRLPLIMQGEAAECGLACLAMVASYHGHEIDLLGMRQRFSLSMRGATLKTLVDIAGVLKLGARPVRIELEELQHLAMPCVLHWNMNHFVVLKKVRLDARGKLRSIRIHDPAVGDISVGAEQVDAAFSGVALELAPAEGFEERSAPPRVRVGQLVRQVRGLRGALVQTFALALALETFALLAPLFMQLVVDGPIASADYDMLTVFALGFGMLMLVQVAVGAFRSWVVMYISTHVGLQWISGVFTHLLHLPLWFFEKRSMGDIISRFGSVNMIQQTLSRSFIETVLDGIMALAALAILLAYSPLLTGVVALALAVYVALRAALYLALRRASEEQLNFKAREQSMFLESLRGIQSIKLFNHERARHSRWFNAQVAAANRTIRCDKLALYFKTGNALLTGVENVAVIWLGARLVMGDSFSLGMLYAFLAYKSIFTGRAYALVDKLQDLRMLSLQGERLADIVLTERESGDDHTPVESLPEGFDIELRGVSFRYSDADPWVIRGLDLVIHTGQSIAIVGPSGCGKTTLLKMLIGILEPTEGEILVGGIPLAQLGARRYRAMLGAVMQDDHLFAGTIADNMCFFDQQVDMAWLEQCADSAAIGADIRAMPMGFQTLVGDMGSSLSGGQKQRLVLARALYKRPRILFLDEATSHLDTSNERRVNEAIHHMAITRVIVAHRQETIASADRVVELAQGAIVRDFLQEQNGALRA
ncbi:peptidase domain-containing ABC transporter [Pseudoduganella sp.]|uniref:peptidase domain-containing ABC transporter n=1 Tax=Pseudoduganella sp. TaxID=1880898 RepID=UPI0035ADFD44